MYNTLQCGKTGGIQMTDSFIPEGEKKPCYLLHKIIHTLDLTGSSLNILASTIY
jgi:hypothetical protein